MISINYQNKITLYSALLEKETRKSKIISYLRLTLFILSALSIYFVTVYGEVEYIFLVLFFTVIAFILFVRQHARIIRNTKLFEAYLKLNTNEAKAMQGDSSNFEDGEEFQKEEHPFAFDIDLFGKGLLFQFLNRTVTRIGKERLADKLKNPKNNKEEIIDLQTRIEGLKNLPEWRQRFQAIGMAHPESDQDKERVLDWVALKPLFHARIFLVLSILTPILTILFTVLTIQNEITEQMFILYLMLPWIFAGSYIKRTNTRHSLVSKTTDMLVKYSLLLKTINDLKAESTGKVVLEKYNLDPEKAGKKLKELSSILNALDNRINPVAWALLNAVFLWDILQMIRLEHWQKKNKEQLAMWFDLISETDALISFANFWSNHPLATLPVFATGNEIVQAKELGHPLIDKSVRVTNQVDIRQGEFVLVTGANMAGKSTYLRTIAANLVLAMCGSAVLASEFRFKPIRLYTSIRTQDSLHKNESYFYAELKRLKAIIDELRSGKELFIILDEILKGTNSKDKHSGSEALLKQLIHLKTCGIVATHDIMLGELEKIYPDHITNQCFEVDISGSRLSFDYKLRKGVSQNMNATLLMRQMGITI
jgi:ABC-type multidrug transport system fused ATPase/permease subunit